MGADGGWIARVLLTLDIAPELWAGADAGTAASKGQIVIDSWPGYDDACDRWALTVSP